MKKEAILFGFLLLLLAIPVISSASIDMKPQYAQGETIIAKVSGNFIDPLLEGNIFFYRGHVRIPMVYDLAKIGDDYYLKASLIGKTPNNYSIKIKDVYYYQSGKASNKEIVFNFSITQDTAAFSIDKGFAFSKSDFAIKAQNLLSSSISIKVETFPGLSSPSPVSISASQIKTLNFNTSNIQESSINFITLSANNLSYHIPISFTYVPPQQQTQPYCGDGTRDTGEQCDTNYLGTIKTCFYFGFNNGTLSCNAPGTTNECQLDLSNCFNTSAPIINNTYTNNTNNTTPPTNTSTNTSSGCVSDSQCGNGKACIDKTCIVIPNENQIVCGNGEKEPGEQCDLNDWGTLKGCSDFSFNNGSLSCKNCIFEVTECFNTFEEICIYNDDCSSGLICSKSQCVPEPQCIYTSDCSLGYRCTNNACIKIQQDCGYFSDCADGYKCENNNCVKIPEELECSREADCDNDENCENHFCIEENGDECEENIDCNSGYKCVDGYCEKNDCKKDFDCKYGYQCLIGDGRCVKKACMENFDCRYGQVCINSTCYIRQGVQCTSPSNCSLGQMCVRGNCVNQTKVDVDPKAVENCNSQSGTVCNSTSYCGGNYNLIPANGESIICCLSSCIEQKKSSKAKIIGWVLIGAIVLFIIWFFKMKSKKTASSV